MKRVFDFALSFIIIICFFPLILLLSLWIKLDSSGPVVFKQKRVGQDQKYFMIYKFRTMRLDTPNKATDLIDHKKYVTKSGRFLRKTSLDEIPQLFNILKGNMSFVGPRPALYNQYRLIKMREKARIHRVKPGITGLAQINGRDDMSDEDKVKWDKKYIDQYSMFIDMKILFKTAFAVLSTRGVRG